MSSRIIVGVTGHRPHKLKGGYDPFSFENKMLTYVFDKKLKKLLNKYDEVVCISGVALGVDTIFAITCLELKREYANRIRLVCAVPFNSQSSTWYPESKIIYNMILEQADSKINTSGLDKVPDNDVKDILQDRNKWIVNNSNVLWAVWDGSPSGTSKCVNYAKTQGVPIEVIDVGLKHSKGAN